MKILICPGSAENQKFKRWSKENFVSLATQLSNKSNEIIILLGPEEIYLNKSFSSFKIMHSLSFSELSKLSNDVDLVICNDSFLMHYFSFLNNNVLAIYGPTNPNRTLPPNCNKICSNNPSIYMPCWGSQQYGRCDKGKCSCFKNLEVDNVLDKTYDLLNIIEK